MSSRAEGGEAPPPRHPPTRWPRRRRAPQHPGRAHPGQRAPPRLLRRRRAPAPPPTRRRALGGRRRRPPPRRRWARAAAARRAARGAELDSELEDPAWAERGMGGPPPSAAVRQTKARGGRSGKVSRRQPSRGNWRRWRTRRADAELEGGDGRGAPRAARAHARHTRAAPPAAAAAAPPRASPPPPSLPQDQLVRPPPSPRSPSHASPPHPPLQAREEELEAARGLREKSGL